MENGKENLRKLRGMIEEVYYPIMSFRERERKNIENSEEEIITHFKVIS